MSRLTAWVSHAVDGDIGSVDFDLAAGRFVAASALLRHPADAVVMPMALSWDRRSVPMQDTHAVNASTPPAGDAASRLFAATRGEQPHIIVYRLSEGDVPGLRTLARAPIASSLAYLEIDPSGRTVVGASYGESRVSVYDVDSLLAAGDGASAPAPVAPVPARQVIDGVANAHAVVISRDGRHVYVPSLGAGQVWCFGLQDGNLTVDEVVDAGADFGPRHMRLSADESFLYVLSEFQAVVTTYARAPDTGRLTRVSTSSRSDGLSALIPGRARPHFTDPDQPDPSELARWIWAADLQLTPDNRFLYLTERTSSRLVVHQRDGNGGWRPTSWIDTETQPRGIAIDASGSYLFACGERSDFLTAYRIDQVTGAVTVSDRCAIGKGANWITLAG